MERTWRHEKAMLALPILVDVAKEEGIITYGELGEAIGVIPVMVGYVVGYVRDYVCCEDKRVKYPLINLLVVNKDTGKPGEHALPEWMGELRDEEREPRIRSLQCEVYRYDGWDAVLAEYGLPPVTKRGSD